mmetsp:Transcript_8329/g.22215  ORF Transcript_8329/g.22215 Transcript_8329/m.22215 type:complete len:222 (-) Transcript_8329:65-730(-)
MQQRNSVELYHGVLALCCLLDLIDPPLHDLSIVLQEVQRADKGCAGNDGRLVHDGLLQVALNLHQELAVDDFAQHPHGVGAVQVGLAVHVLHQRAGDDDDLVRGGADVLDAQVHHSAQVRVLALKQLGHREEHLRCLLLGEGLSLAQQVQQLGDDLLALPGIDLGIIEAASLLEHSPLVNAVEGRELSLFGVLVLGLVVHGVPRSTRMTTQVSSSTLFLNA